MRFAEYMDYKNGYGVEQTISASEIPNEGWRVLVEGYTLDREDFTVYHDPDAGLIRRYIGNEMQAFEKWSAYLLAPSKRAYPDRTDYHFAVLMRDRGAELSFTRHPDENR